MPIMKNVFLLEATIYNKNCMFVKTECYVGESPKTLERLKVLLDQVLAEQGLIVNRYSISRRKLWKETNF